MMLSPDIVMRQNHEVTNMTTNEVEEVIYESHDIKSTQTTIPFVKENNFDYASLTNGWAITPRREDGYYSYLSPSS